MDELNKLFGDTEKLWQSIISYAGKAGREATRMILELYYVLKSPNTPALDKTIIVAALGYQLLPSDLMSKENFGWLGFLDNGAALALAYNRVKSRVTPQIEFQVEAILNQWFGDSLSSNEPYLEPQTVNVPVSQVPVEQPNRINGPSGGYNDDEDVVID